MRKYANRKAFANCHFSSALSFVLSGSWHSAFLPTISMNMRVDTPRHFKGKVCSVRDFHKNLRFVHLLDTGVSCSVAGSQTTNHVQPETDQNREQVELVLRKEHAHVKLNTGDTIEAVGVYDEFSSRRMQVCKPRQVNTLELKPIWSLVDKTIHTSHTLHIPRRTMSLKWSTSIGIVQTPRRIS
jgi:hypothetical protein